MLFGRHPNRVRSGKPLVHGTQPALAVHGTSSCGVDSRSSSREVRIRVPDFSFCRLF